MDTKRNLGIVALIFATVLPCLMFFLIPALERLPEWRTPAGKARTALFCALVAAGFLIHFRGANVKATWDWNAFPVNIDA